MTEQEWGRCADPWPMLEHLRAGGRASQRKLTLFAAACCRCVWQLLYDPRCPRAVEVAEEYADGRASREEVAAAGEGARDAARAIAEESRAGSAVARGGATPANAHAATAAA